MKYFREELLVTTGVEAVDIETDLLWKKSTQEYKARFETLKGKIPANTWNVLNKTNLHDFKFVNLKVTERNDYKKRPTSIILQFSRSIDIFQIEYTKIRQFKLIFNENDTGINYLGIDDCVYSELLDIEERLFSHELLFSSGATFYIEFEKIKLSKIKPS